MYSVLLNGEQLMLYMCEMFEGRAGVDACRVCESGSYTRALATFLTEL